MKNQTSSHWRATWKGQLRFGLVSFAVEAINARNSDRGDIHFNQLHAKCHQRIRYEKVCPIHGKVEKDEIVSGYQYSRGKYVEIEPDELNELRSENEKSLTIDNFIAPNELDLIYFDGRMYYLVPHGADAVEPYHLLASALEQEKRMGVGHIVMSGKDQIAAIRSVDGHLQMAMLNYQSELRPAKEFPKGTGKLAPRKIQLAKDLIRSWSEEEFAFSDYEDRYRNRLVELIDAKVEGNDIVETTEGDEEPTVINLMDALKRSMKTTGRKPGGRTSTKRSTPARKTTKPRKRKSRAS